MRSPVHHGISSVSALFKTLGLCWPVNPERRVSTASTSQHDSSHTGLLKKPAWMLRNGHAWLQHASGWPGPARGGSPKLGGVRLVQDVHDDSAPCNAI